jgi:hypothetical protein
MKRRLRRFETAWPDRPLGPADCLKTRFPGKCSKCGADTARLHVPTGLVPGKFLPGLMPGLQRSGRSAPRNAHRVTQIYARDQMTAKLLRFSHLSPPRQALVRLLQNVNYGQIKVLFFRDGEPIYDPAPVVVIDAKLYRDDGPRPELALADFELRDDVLRLMARLDTAKSGTIQFIEVRAGLPRRVVLESRSTGPL